MTTERKDPTFFERFVAPLVTIFVISSLLGGVVMLGVMPKYERLGIVLFCVVIVVMIALLAMLHNRVLRHYRCPQCRAELPRHNDDARREEYLFYCKSCDVIWKTGLRQGGE